MDVTQAATNAWLQSIATNPIMGAAGMALLIVCMQYLKGWLPFLGGSGQGGRSPDPEGPRALQNTLNEASEHLESINDELRRQTELKRRLCETLERSERLLLELAAREKAASPPAPRRVRAGE